MEQVKKTYQEVIEFYNHAQRYMQTHTEENKFHYALTRTCKTAGRVVGEYRDKIGEIEVTFCLAADDGKGEILHDDRGKLKFTKDGFLKCAQEQSKLFKSEVTLDVHFASEIPNELSLADRENFNDFVIRPKENEE